MVLEISIPIIVTCVYHIERTRIAFDDDMINDGDSDLQREPIWSIQRSLRSAISNVEEDTSFSKVPFP